MNDDQLITFGCLLLIALAAGYIAATVRKIWQLTRKEQDENSHRHQ